MKLDGELILIGVLGVAMATAVYALLFDCPKRTFPSKRVKGFYIVLLALVPGIGVILYFVLVVFSSRYPLKAAS